MPAKKLSFNQDGVDYVAREFTLADYPEAERLFKLLGGSTEERRDGMVGLLGLAVGIDKDQALGFTLKEALEVLNKVLEVNGRLPKEEAPAAQENPAQ